jgi:uncharacterized protein
MAIASLRTNVAIAAVLVLLFVTFLLLTLGEFGISALATVGGYLGLATALAAWYASAAVVTNETWGRVVLPVGARS